MCTTIPTNSVLPVLTYRKNVIIDQLPVSTNEIIPLICKLNPNKATGPDGIPAQMLLLCGETIALPLKIIFSNILAKGILPSCLKLANVSHIDKKINNCSINTGLLPFYQFVAKSSKR